MAASAWTPVDETASAWTPVAETPPAPPPSAASRLGTNFLSGMGVTSNEQAKNFFVHPLDTVIQSFERQGELAKKARDAYNKGDYMGALQHGLNYLVPFVGQQTDQAGEQLKSGDIAGGVGRTLGAAVPIAAGSPEVQSSLGDIASAAAATARPALAKAGSVATGIGQSLDPDLVGLVSPRAAHALRLATKVGKVATKLGTKGAPEVTPEVAAPEASAPEVEPPPSPAAPAATSPAAASATTPEAVAPAAPVDTSPKAVQQQLNDALGGKPLQRGVSLRNQGKPNALPQGFTPVESSALKGYKYDPGAKEFTAISNNGQMYTHGEVTPEEVQTFADADSQGKAWNTIRQNHVLVKQNGLPVKPSGGRSVVLDPDTGQPEFSDVLAAKGKRPAPIDSDLTALLQQSLAKVRAKKGTP